MDIYHQIASNNRRTVFILILFFAAIIGIFAAAFWIGEVPLEDFPMTSASVFVFLLIWTSIGYFAGARMILHFVGAKEVSRKEYFNLYNTVENLSITVGIPCPKIYLIEDQSLNAFATGRDPQHGIVCVTSGILKKLDKRELEGVLAHEMGHIMNYDIRLQLMVVAVIGAISMLGEILLRTRSHGQKKGNPLALAGLFIYLVGGLVFYLIRLALSRNREFLADASGSLYTRDPEALALALEKIAIDPRIESADHITTAAHLFISDPREENHDLKKVAHRQSWFWNLFSTHPAVGERIRRLRGGMAEGT